MDASRVECGSSDAGFLARAPPADDGLEIGAPRPWDPYFPPQDIRSLRPFPADAPGAAKVELLQASVRRLLQEEDYNWTLVSILGVHDLRSPGPVRPTILIILTPNSTRVEQATTIVRRILYIQKW